MPVKVTLKIQLATNISSPNAIARRIGGWSESVYYPGTNVPNAIFRTNGGEGIQDATLCISRAALLPIGAAIVGQRFQLVDPVGLAQSTSLLVAGTSSNPADIPQMSLLCRAPSVGLANIGRLTIRGIPDVFVVEGEYAPAAFFTTALRTYFRALGYYTFKGRDLSQPAVKILTVDTAGLVQTETPHALAPNNMVRVLRTLDTKREQQGGRFQVNTVGPGTNALTLRNWTFGACTGGTIRLDGTVYAPYDSANITVSRIVTRKVGRPFTQYRGRASARGV